MAVLPDFMSFGGMPFGTFPDLAPLSAEDAVLAPAANPTPLGVDFGFDHLAGEFIFTNGGDLVIVGEEQALEQWMVVALVTPRGREYIHGYTFGSQISELIGAGHVTDSIISDSVQFIREAILIHDRLVDVQNIKYDFAVDGSESIVFYFDVVSDDNTRFQFGGLQVG